MQRVWSMTLAQRGGTFGTAEIACAKSPATPSADVMLKVLAQSELTPLRLIALGIQHVLALFAGTVAVPLIVAGALGMSPAETAFLVSAALVAGGVATFIHTPGFGPVGSRLPFVCGTDFTFVGHAISVGKVYGFSGVLGGAMLASLVEVAIGLCYRYVKRFFPPLVSGTVVLLIGLTLMPVSVDWAAGGAGAADYGAPRNLLLALFVLAVILLISAYARGFLQRVAVLLGFLAGYVVALPLGWVDLSVIDNARWVAIPWPLTIKPTFHLAAALPFAIAYMVTSIETAGQVFALAEVCGEKADESQVRGGILADAVASGLAGLLNALPTNAFSQNIGLVKLTGVVDRSVAATAGALCVVLGLCPKLGAVVAVMPRPVLGGAGLVMFGMVAVAGIDMLRRVELGTREMLVLAVSLAIGMAIAVRPEILSKLPQTLATALGSPITAGALAAFVLNALLGTRERSD